MNALPAKGLCSGPQVMKKEFVKVFHMRPLFRGREGRRKQSGKEWSYVSAEREITENQVEHVCSK